MIEHPEVYANAKIYESSPIRKDPLIDRISKPALIAFFRCNSCYTCKWRKEVLENDPDPKHDIHWCSRKHEKYNLADMVRYLGYSKE